MAYTMSQIKLGDFIKSSGWCGCAEVYRETADDYLEDLHSSTGSNNEGYTHHYAHHSKKLAVHNCRKHPHYRVRPDKPPKCHDCFRAFVKMSGTWQASRVAPELFHRLFK